MKVFHGIDRLPAFRHPAATVGSFDGVHGGHSELLAAVRRFARERDGESIVVTFSPHPRIVLETQTDLRLLTTLDEKAWLLERAGIDNHPFHPRIQPDGFRRFHPPRPDRKTGRRNTRNGV